MAARRNPFRLRASENATSDEEFIALFGPKVLDGLPEDGLWDRLVIIASAPGAGKTSILRLFTPGVLRLLNEMPASEDTRELRQRLQALGALGSTGPEVLGIMVECRDQYAAIEQLPIEPGARRSWFLGLLDARIHLLALRAERCRSRISLTRLTSDALSFARKPMALAPVSRFMGRRYIRRRGSWRTNFRTRLTAWEALSRLSPPARLGLDALRQFSDESVYVDGRPVANRLLLMFDDVQDLAETQRRALRAELESRTLRIGRWIAERYQALAPHEVLTSARTEGRDFLRILKLEDWARGAASKSSCTTSRTGARSTQEKSFQNFGASLAPSLATEQERTRTRQAATTTESSAGLPPRGKKGPRVAIRAREGASDDAYGDAVR